ncbi:HAMP domain-containing sensor histidine kinase [Cytophagaceae bacterium DM2B3-1]|uniref:histidine kinase n=1 Tax=Xanthocytophaga flava TaxID=3048013 RepID=A0ABT7CQY7_9BACT|nr:HAMP domain-containing sensor histidine kinase [Xanthocytophaga flavus]MDJ1496137.1 HAMP domain-containing sensor histidine kinase [Xanthocytophaga flavus]
MRIVEKHSLSMSLLLITGLVLFSVNIYWFYSNYREDEFYHRLRQAALNMEQLIFTKGSSKEQLRLLEALQDDPYSKRQIIIYDSIGTILFRSTGAVAHLNEAYQKQVLKKEVEFRKDGYERTLFVSRNNPSRKLLILEAAGYDLGGFNKQKKLRTTLILGSLILIALQGLATWYFMRRDLLPLSRIASQMKQISGPTFHQRLSESNLNNEIGQMSHAFNELLDRVEKAYQQQFNFISYASHELRTPLAILLSNSQVTLFKERTTEEYVQTLKSFQDDVNQMILLVNSLLELARLNADAQSVSFSCLRLDEQLWAASDLLKENHPDYQIHIDFATIGDTDEAMLVMGNARLLMLVFKNLMENACKYSSNKKVVVNIQAGQQQVLVNVCDEGIGMSAAELEHIFDAFYRNGQHSKIAGYGIGLPLAKRILEIHRGSIVVQSVKDKGSVFTVTLPTWKED